jgi:hypothetical protein
MAKAVERLLCECKALSSNHSPNQKKKRKNFKLSFSGQIENHHEILWVNFKQSEDTTANV